MRDYERLPEGIRNANLPDLLTVAEVAERLRISKMTVYRLIHTEQLPAIRLGRSFRVPAPAVAAIVNSEHPRVGQPPEEPAERPPTA
jgi:excisionase family DNA binding protein